MAAEERMNVFTLICVRFKEFITHRMYLSLYSLIFRWLFVVFISVCCWCFYYYDLFRASVVMLNNAVSYLLFYLHVFETGFMVSVVLGLYISGLYMLWSRAIAQTSV